MHTLLRVEHRPPHPIYPPLLSQARREVIEQHFDQSRLAEALARLRGARVVLTHPSQPTPLVIPLLESRLTRSVATTESVAQRVARMRRGRR